MWLAQVRNLRDAEQRLRMKVRESESELDILKRRQIFSNMSFLHQSEFLIEGALH